MATKPSGLLTTLGKRILGFNASSTGCCASAAGQAADKTETKATNEPAADGCCGSAATPEKS